MANRKLSRAELIKANELLKLHLTPSEKEGYFKYINEFSDAKIAQEIATDIQATTIGNVRLELFGKLDFSATITKEDNTRITKVEEVITNLMKELEELRVKHRKLCENLQLNRVIDVKHLA